MSVFSQSILFSPRSVFVEASSINSVSSCSLPGFLASSACNQTVKYNSSIFAALSSNYRHVVSHLLHLVCSSSETDGRRSTYYFSDAASRSPQPKPVNTSLPAPFRIALHITIIALNTSFLNNASRSAPTPARARSASAWLPSSLL